MESSGGEAAAEWKVAVAIDGSDESLHALGWGLRNVLSSTAPNKLVLVYARPPPPFMPTTDTSESGGDRRRFHDFETDFVPHLELPDSGYLFTDEDVATMEQYSQDLEKSVLAKAQAILQPHEHVKVDTKVATGDAREVICDTVERIGADMLVMGSHGYGFVKRALLGSVSDYCVHHAKCPVLIVKRP
ncbi:universal stress protein A-like protein isoform X1 [Wolffia australiana]